MPPLRRRPAYRRRAPAKKNYRNRASGLRRRLGIQGRTHMIKRLGEPIFCQNQASGIPGILQPTLTQDGLGSFTLGSITPDTTMTNSVSFGMGASFQLKSVLDASDLTQLFDRYKIVGVKLKFLLQNNNADIGSSQMLPVMYVAFDGDDANVPVTYDQVLSKSYCKTHILTGNRELKAYYKPRITKEVYNSPLTTGYTSEKACWIDCNSSGIPHYGVKFWIANWNISTVNQVLRVQPVYYLALKDPQ